MEIFIDKNLRDRISSWLSDSEDPSLLCEALGRDVDPQEAEVLLKKEATAILYKVLLLTMEGE